MRIIKTALCALSMAVGLGACAGHNLLGQVVDDNLYVGGVAQPKGPVAIRPTNSFRFVEKWRISHAWVQGTGVRPCRYPGNIFRDIPGYPALANEPDAPMFERNGRVYYGTTFEKTQGQIVFSELSYQFFGERPSNRVFDGKYTPFCAQHFSSPNGMAVLIVKPDPSKGTDDWIAGAVPIKINGRTWLVKKIPPVDKGPDSLRSATMEHWTLKIPDTPYWLHFEFSGSQRSVQQYADEHAHLLNLFHQLIESVRLEPITPVDPASMPPFVLAY